MQTCKILALNNNFEHDVYALIKAFFPEMNIEACEGKQDNNCDLFFLINLEENKFNIEITYNKEKYVASVNSAISDDVHEKRREDKTIIKQATYKILSKITNKSLPWGNLTGIRPTKLAMSLVESGLSNVETAKILREKYFLSPKKTALAITIANRERDLLSKVDYKNGYSLYIGIPFCPSICLYCSFSSYPLKVYEKKVQDYVNALKKEIREVGKILKNRKLDTVYIGGGTPTTLSPSQLHEIITELKNSFPMEHTIEFTCEAGRPDSITREKLITLKNDGVTRISVNPQSMNQRTLEIIGRAHTVTDTISAFKLAREVGMNNINMDIIVGLPKEGKNEIQYTLDEIEKLDPDSLTIHSLAVKRASRLNKLMEQYKDESFYNNEEIMEMALKSAHNMNMAPYYLYRQKNMAGNLENIGYSKEGKAGIYNILIMEEKQPIIALGASGSSKIVYDNGNKIERVETVKDVDQYIQRIDEMIERKRKAINLYL